MSTLSKLFGSLVCHFNGHKRGKYRCTMDAYKYYHCPRCGRVTKYKVKQKELSL